VNRDDFVSESDQPFGALSGWRSGDSEEEQTLAGLIYSQPERKGGSFSASVGARVRSSQLDPYAKVSYRYRRILWGDALFAVKQTVFYQLSEQFGLTTRLDFERMLSERWHMAWRGAATISEGTEGVRGTTHLTFTRNLPGRQALVSRLELDFDTAPPIPIAEFGVKVAYRRSVIRDWLILELQTSVTWPHHLREHSRKASWGFGLGCEIYFGNQEFSSRPVTF
jgi:hypothetical protein